MTDAVIQRKSLVVTLVPLPAALTASSKGRHRCLEPLINWSLSRLLKLKQTMDVGVAVGVEFLFSDKQQLKIDSEKD
uniref:Uncharacterized protein n=1 Tax=Romanomermis culicivorax TaxID=13658 RepID=A0A915KTH8_ROMCU